MGSARKCPSKAMGLCQAKCKGKIVCYALKAEWLYPAVLPYRERQEKYWKSHSAAEFIRSFLDINACKKNPYKAIRLNESGDFWDQDCVNKAEEIAKGLKAHGIITYVYTARQDLDYSQVKNLVINGSGFLKEGIKNVFLYIENKVDRPKGYGICAGDCRICKRCLTRGKLTCVIKH